MTLFASEALLREYARLEYEAGESLVKSAGDAVKSYSLSGRLYLAKSGWLLLSVPNNLIRGTFDALHEAGAEYPPPFKGSSAYQAHITVMRPEEVEQAGGADAITERGHQFHYTTGPLREVEPANWDGVSKVWYIEIGSPELEKLRKSYGLSAKPKNNEHDFHITVAIRKKNILTTKPVSKSASDDAHDYCPTCGKKFVMSCRCMNAGHKCEDGHSWHRCRVHKVTALGMGHGTGDETGCTCNSEKTSAATLPLPSLLLRAAGKEAAEFLLGNTPDKPVEGAGAEIPPAPVAPATPAELKEEIAAEPVDVSPNKLASVVGDPGLHRLMAMSLMDDVMMAHLARRRLADAKRTTPTLPAIPEGIKSANVVPESIRNIAGSPPVQGFLQQFGLNRNNGVNLFDTAKAQYEANQHHVAISQAADADRDTYKQLIRGVATMAGAPRGPQFESGIDEASKHITKLAPHLMTMFPETWDQLHGNRGSAASLASAFAKAHPERTGAENAANAQTVFKNLYGSPGKAPPGGLGARDLGRLYTGMNREGLLSAKGGLEPAQLAGRLGHAGTAARSIIDTVAAHGKQAFDLRTTLSAKLNPPTTEMLPSAVDTAGRWRGFKPLSAAQRNRFLQTSEVNNAPTYFREPPRKPDVLLRMQHPETAYDATQTVKQAISLRTVNNALQRSVERRQKARVLLDQSLRGTAEHARLSEQLAKSEAQVKKIYGTYGRWLNEASVRAINSVQRPTGFPVLNPTETGKSVLDRATSLIPPQYRSLSTPSIQMGDSSGSYSYGINPHQVLSPASVITPGAIKSRNQWPTLLHENGHYIDTQGRWAVLTPEQRARAIKDMDFRTANIGEGSRILLAHEFGAARKGSQLLESLRNNPSASILPEELPSLSSFLKSQKSPRESYWTAIQSAAVENMHTPGLNFRNMPNRVMKPLTGYATKDDIAEIRKGLSDAKSRQAQRDAQRYAGSLDPVEASWRKGPPTTPKVEIPTQRVPRPAISSPVATQPQTVDRIAASTTSLPVPAAQGSQPAIASSSPPDRAVPTEATGTPSWLRFGVPAVAAATAGAAGYGAHQMLKSSPEPLGRSKE